MENLLWYFRLSILNYLSLKVLDLIEFSKKGIKYGDTEVLFKDAVVETAISYSEYKWNQLIVHFSASFAATSSHVAKFWPKRYRQKCCMQFSERLLKRAYLTKR